MDVQFWYTTKEKLAGLDIKDGRIIALSDESGYYYDMGGKRHRVCDLKYVDTLPDLNTTTEAAAATDILYLTADGVFRWDKENKDWIALVPIDVKEVESDDNYAYVRQEKGWTPLRWLICSRADMPATSVFELISVILAGRKSTSIKVSGTVTGNPETLSVSIGADAQLFLDFTDCEFSSNPKITFTVEAATSLIQISGSLPGDCTLVGEGVIKLTNSTLPIPNTINPTILGKDSGEHRFNGTLILTGCIAHNSQSHDAVLIKLPNGTCMINSCVFGTGKLKLPANSLVEGNMLNGTVVEIDSQIVDPLYNNAGYVHQTT